MRLKLIESFCYERNVDDDNKGNNTGYSSHLLRVNLEKWNLMPGLIDWETEANRGQLNPFVQGYACSEGLPWPCEAGSFMCLEGGKMQLDQEQE